MRKDSLLSLKVNPRFKSQLFKYSVQLVCYFTYNTEELASGKKCKSWLFKKFYVQMGIFLSNLPSCVSKISKYRPGCCNMPIGVRGARMFGCSFTRQSCSPLLYLQRCKSNIKKRHSSLPTSNQAPVLLVVKPSSSLL